MVIQCPRCSTRFKVADHLVAGKAVKLKCSKCMNVFVHGAPAVGPKEPSHPRTPAVERPAGRLVGAPDAAAGRPLGTRAVRPAEPGPEAPEPPVQQAASQVEAYESFEAEPPAPVASAVAEYESFEAEPPAPGPAEEPEAQDPGTGDAMPDPELVTSPDGLAAQPARRPAPASHDSMPMLTLDDVLPVEPPPSRLGRAAGIGFLVLLGVALLGAIAVLWRNGWDLGACTADPIHAIEVAAGSKARVVVDEEAEGIETSVVDTYKALTGDEREILVVEGEVLNTTVFPKRMVTVLVSIVSSSGEAVQVKEVLAGVTLRTRAEIKSRSFLELDDELRDEAGRASSWVIRANRKASFQVFFTTYPPGVDDGSLYTIEARVKDAQNAAGE